ncbi:MAG: MazG-like family protein [Patulibacter sp.]|nr:MazG-like family protein [Patulibacter sp.]
MTARKTWPIELWICDVTGEGHHEVSAFTPGPDFDPDAYQRYVPAGPETDPPAARLIHERLLELDGLDQHDQYTEILRVAKPAEEAGEAMQALIAYHGVNPRKAKGPLSDLVQELADVVLAAKVAIESFSHDSTEVVAQREREVLARLEALAGEGNGDA